jgi:hypothetical protein
VSHVDKLLAEDYPRAELPTTEDSVTRIVRYSLIGRPDFVHGFSQPRTWAPHDLMIRFDRHTAYCGKDVTERSQWRMTTVELHAWLRLKSGGTSDKIEVLIEFDDLPHEYVPRSVLDKPTAYPKVKAVDFPYVQDMIEACRPAAGELV